MAGANAFARESANSNRQPLAQRKRKTISRCNNFTDAHRVGYATANCGGSYSVADRVANSVAVAVHLAFRTAIDRYDFRLPV